MRFETFFRRTIKTVIPLAISGFVVVALISGLPNSAKAANAFFYTALGGIPWPSGPMHRSGRDTFHVMTNLPKQIRARHST